MAFMATKNYFESNEEARKYFLSNLNEDEFYNSILKVAENNFIYLLFN